MSPHLMILAQGAEDGSSNPLAQVLMVAGVALLLFLAVVNGRKHLRRRQQEPALTPHEKVERIKQTHGMKNDLRDMMVELEDLTRRFSAQLDAKAVRLERLIEEADARITQLERAGRSAGESANREAARVTTVAGKGAEAASGDGTPAEPLDPLTRNVYELADAGHEPLAIAKQLDEHVGKVELILALREP